MVLGGITICMTSGNGAKSNKEKEMIKGQFLYFIFTKDTNF